jgi:hypothetical protein
MQFLNLIFLLVVVSLGYVVFLAIWTGLVFLFRVRRKGMVCAISLPVFLVALVGWLKWQERPAAQFERSFGFPPPADVQGLESNVWALGDSGTVYMRFKAAPPTVRRIVARGLSAGTSNTIGLDNPPTGWNPSPAPPAQRYEGSFSQSFASELETLIYDPATGDVWFHMSGVD